MFFLPFNKRGALKFLLGVLVLIPYQLIAQSTISAGDMAIIGWNADGDDDVLLVSFVEVEAGTVLYLTDKSWTGDSFSGSEGYNQYTVPEGGISAGDVLLITSCNDNPTSNNGGAVIEISGFNLSGSGDELYLYTGTDEDSPIDFLFALTTKSGWGENELLNTGLTEGLTALSIWGANDDNGEYIGSRSGTQSEILDLIRTAESWNTTDGSGDQSIDFSILSFTVSSQSNESLLLQSSTPQDGATDFSDKEIILSFNQPVFKGMGSIVIKDASDDSELVKMGVNHPAVNIDGSTASIKLPSFLPLDRELYINISSKAFKTSQGVFFEGISDNSTLGFFTETTPKILSSSPEDDETDFASRIVTLTFDRNVYKGVGTISVHNSSDNSEVWKKGVNHPSISISESEVSINLGSRITINQNLYVKIGERAFYDENHNFFLGIDDAATLNFSTASSRNAGTASPFSLSGLKSSIKAEGIRVYPNPANQIVNISLRGIGGESAVSILNMEGRKVFYRENVQEDFALDVSSYDKGIFLVSILTTEGERIVQKLAIVK